jgi:hypothetical protein
MAFFSTFNLMLKWLESKKQKLKLKQCQNNYAVHFYEKRCIIADF